MKLAKWAIGHPVPMNLLMFLVLFLGCGAAFLLQREMFPKFSTDIVEVTIFVEDGSTPDQVDRNINQLVQPRIQQIDGVREVTSIATEKLGKIIVELHRGYDSEKVKRDIKDEIDTIQDFPEKAEDTRVVIIKQFEKAIRLAVYGEHATDFELRQTLDHVKEDLRAKGIISKWELFAPRSYELAIQIPLETLQAKNLSMEDIAAQVRGHNLELRAGKIKSKAGDIIIKGDARKTDVDKLRKIPIQFPNGEFISLEQLAGPNGIKDGFVEDEVIVQYKGQRAAVLTVEKSENEDIIDLCNGVIKYAEEVTLPYGLQITAFHDSSVFVKDRLQLIIKNGLIGLFLVFCVMTLFLEWRIAFWATLGIAFSLIGTLFILYITGYSINMLTLFAFLLATGMIVDDAIVMAEGFFAYRKEGVSGVESAKKAIGEVSWPIFAMMSTSAVAFAPTLFVSGIMGKFIANLPIVVISGLILSLFESLFILPAHLAMHCDGVGTVLMRVMRIFFLPFIYVARPLQAIIVSMLNSFSTHILGPLVRKSIHYRYASAVLMIAALILVFGMIPTGILKTALFPNVDSEFHEANLEFEMGTSIQTTAAATEQVIQELIRAGNWYAERDGISPVHDYFVDIGSEGSHKARIIVQLLGVDQGRKISGQEFLDTWRKSTPSFPGIVSLEYTTRQGGPPAKAIEYFFTGNDDGIIQNVVDEAKAYLSKLEGVVDVSSSDRLGPETIEVRLMEKSDNLPVSEAELISSLAAIYQGIKVDTFFRGDSEVNMYVRASPEDRADIHSLRNIELPNGLRVGQVAELNVTREAAEIRRVNGAKTIAVFANVDLSSGANAVELRGKFREEFLDELPFLYPSIRWTESGESEDGREAMQSLLQGYIPALMVIYLILATIFSSYIQPLVVMVAIPFCLIGALLGHLFMGFAFNLMSVFGVVGLTGIAVNDSLVLVDCINSQLKEGRNFYDALVSASQRRLRPIFLTSLTTCAGMGPIMLETSFQAQFLIPMVTSITFGIAFATPLILLIVPVALAILADIALLFYNTLLNRELSREELFAANIHE